MSVLTAGLPSRFDLRVLEAKHIPWAAAIFALTNISYSPIFTVAFPERQTKRVYDVYEACTYLITHQVESGLSLGVFDKEYEFKWPESAATGGAVYWDTSDKTATREQLLEQMDFPLVSHALAYDSFNPLDLAEMQDIMVAVPSYKSCMDLLATTDKRDKTWQCKGPSEVLFRNSTSTRPDYEGQKLMKKMAHYMMRDVAAKGWRGIQIEAFNEAVIHVWANPPSPFKGEIVSETDAWNFAEETEYGEKVHPYRPAEGPICKIYVTLR